jgi:hypothetical protein
LPASIAAGAVQVLEFTKNEASGLYIFTSEYVPVAV